MHQEKTVAFDIGGVLIDWNPRYLYRKLIDEEPAIEKFLATICTADWNRKQDEGRPWSDAVAELSEQFPDYKLLIEAFWLRWAEMIQGPVEGASGLLNELKQNQTPMYALSNWSNETFPIAVGQFDFLDWFDGILISGDVGVTKPDPGIYQLFVTKFALDPRQVIFIDDQLENIRAAREFGFTAHHFCNTRLVREFLITEGILNN